MVSFHPITSIASIALISPCMLGGGPNFPGKRSLGGEVFNMFLILEGVFGYFFFLGENVLDILCVRGFDV